MGVTHANVTIRYKTVGSQFQGRNKSALMNCVLGLCCTSRMRVLTIFGFAGAVVWLQQVALHTAAGVGALRVCARLAARPVHIAFIEIYRRGTECITYS